MEGGYASSLVASPTKRELSEKELEAESALLMLLSRGEASTVPRAVENGLHEILNHHQRFPDTHPDVATTSSSTSPSLLNGRRTSARLANRAALESSASITAASSSTLTSAELQHRNHPTTSDARVSIKSLLNDVEDDAVDKAAAAIAQGSSGRGLPPFPAVFGAGGPLLSTSRSTPTSPVFSSASPLPPFESLLSAGGSFEAGGSLTRTSSSIDLRAADLDSSSSTTTTTSTTATGRNRGAKTRKLLSSSSPVLAQKPAGGSRKRKAAAAKSTGTGVGSSTTAAATPATAAAAAANNKHDRRTKKQRQLELLQSVNNAGRLVGGIGGSGDLAVEDIAAALASSPLAFSSPFLPSVLAASRRERAAAAEASASSAGDADRPSSAEADASERSAGLMANVAAGVMLPPAAPHLVSSVHQQANMNSPLPSSAASSPLPSSLAQLQQFLPSALPASVDQQRILQLKSQLLAQQQQSPDLAGSTTTATTPTATTPAAVAVPGGNMQSMVNKLSLNLNISPHQASRFGDKKRERRDSFSFTYPSRGANAEQAYQPSGGGGGSSGSGGGGGGTPLPQHQQEFLQQLLQQIHKKQTVVPAGSATPTMAEEATDAGDGAETVPTPSPALPAAAPTSPSLFRFYQRPYKVLPTVASPTVPTSMSWVSPGSNSEPHVVGAVVDVPTEVVRSEAHHSPMMAHASVQEPEAHHQPQQEEQEQKQQPLEAPVSEHVQIQQPTEMEVQQPEERDEVAERDAVGEPQLGQGMAENGGDHGNNDELSNSSQEESVGGTDSNYDGMQVDDVDNQPSAYQAELPPAAASSPGVGPKEGEAIVSFPDEGRTKDLEASNNDHSAVEPDDQHHQKTPSQQQQMQEPEQRQPGGLNSSIAESLRAAYMAAAAAAAAASDGGAAGNVADDVFAARRRKASPQQMAILEQIWSTTGFGGALRASTSLDFTSSFPQSLSSAVSAASAASPSSMASSLLLGSSLPLAGHVSPPVSKRRSSPLLSCSPTLAPAGRSLSASPVLSFTISSPNLPSFLASASTSTSTAAQLKAQGGTEPGLRRIPTAAVHVRADVEDEEDSGLWIVADDDIDDEGDDAGTDSYRQQQQQQRQQSSEREVEVEVLSSTPTTGAFPLERATIVFPTVATTAAAAYDRATRERSAVLPLQLPSGAPASASTSTMSALPSVARSTSSTEAAATTTERPPAAAQGAGPRGEPQGNAGAGRYGVAAGVGSVGA